MNDTKIERKSISLMLTSAGLNFFLQRKVKIDKFPNQEGNLEYGVSLDEFSPAFIQKMLLKGYVSRLEISGTEFTSRRQEVIDLTKLIVYGILYRQFSNELFMETILESPLIKDYNRQKPGNQLDERTRFDPGMIEAYLRKNQSKQEFIKKSLLSPVVIKLQSDTRLQPDERNKKNQICEKFLDSLPPFVWYILMNFQGSRNFVSLMSNIRSCLFRYLEKTSVAEYLALMLIEILSYAQNKNIQNYVQKRYSNKISLRTLVADPQLRGKVIGEMKKGGVKLYLSWKITPLVAARSEKHKLEVTVFNHEAEYIKFKQEIAAKGDVNIHERNIIDFCKENPGEELNPELGFLYISYLSDECRRVNIHFDSSVYQIPYRDLTVMTSTLRF